MDKSHIRFVLDLSWRQISLNPFFRPVFELGTFAANKSILSGVVKVARLDFLGGIPPKFEH